MIRKVSNCILEASFWMMIIRLRIITSREETAFVLYLRNLITTLPNDRWMGNHIGTHVRMMVVMQRRMRQNTAIQTKTTNAMCGESYGTVDAKNHVDLKHSAAKAATVNEEGNIEYWYCPDVKSIIKMLRERRKLPKPVLCSLQRPQIRPI